MSETSYTNRDGKDAALAWMRAKEKAPEKNTGAYVALV